MKLKKFFAAAIVLLTAGQAMAQMMPPRGKTEQLANYFSEYALIRYRVRVEIEYFITLCELPLPQLASFDKSLFERLRDIVILTKMKHSA